MSNKIKVLLGFAIAAIVGTFLLVDPISQPAAYHDFADKRTWLGIPNFWNVMSNLAYLVPGIMGLHAVQSLRGDKTKFKDPAEVFPLYVVFLGAIFLGFGSGFYHLFPFNETLVADRSTMTVGFMGVLAFMVAERMSVKWGVQILPTALAIGIFSVIYWIYTENMGAGDLRYYGLVQFLPLVFILTLLLWFPPRYSETKYVWWAFSTYAAAKVFEHFDKDIWNMLGQNVSGHTLKHLVSGVGIYFLVLYVKRRKAL